MDIVQLKLRLVWKYTGDDLMKSSAASLWSKKDELIFITMTTTTRYLIFIHFPDLLLDELLD